MQLDLPLFIMFKIIKAISHFQLKTDREADPTYLTAAQEGPDVHEAENLIKNKSKLDSSLYNHMGPEECYSVMNFTYSE